MSIKRVLPFDRQELAATRRALVEQLQPFALAYSADGRTFEYQAPLSAGIPLGGYVIMRVGEQRAYFGQVLTRETTHREGPDISVGSGDEWGNGSLASMITGTVFRTRLVITKGTGNILGRISTMGIMPTEGSDAFNEADIDNAPDEDVGAYLSAAVRGSGALDVGRALRGGESARAMLLAAGMNRHTLLCGQSGSGKTFALGVILERLLLQTNLKLVILDPNSDFAGLGEARPLDSFNQTRSKAMTGEEHARLVERYASATRGLRVLRPSAHDGRAEPLRVRFSDLERQQQAAVLQLAPLADREEFNGFWHTVDGLGERDFDLADVQEVALRDLSIGARQLALRIANLGVADWALWSRDNEASVGDLLAAEHRALVVDIGDLGCPQEKSVAAAAVLDHVWRHREARRPMLIVIDEAHNVCPSEPLDPLQHLVTEQAIRIAGEGRKYGIYLLLASQRPAKIHPNVLSQCQNLILMHVNSSADLTHLSQVFSHVPASLLGEASRFGRGQALVAGRITPAPLFVQFEGRLSREGDNDIPADWIC